MALKIGELKPDANEGMILDEGMSLEIYKKLDFYLSPPLQEAVDNAEEVAKPAAQEALDQARLGWKKLSYSIAYGVIEHIKSNMEINGITTKGDVSITISGSTGIADPADHTHSVGLSDTDSDVVFTQNNDGTGLVE